jgi:hypothetical protein
MGELEVNGGCSLGAEEEVGDSTVGKDRFLQTMAELEEEDQAVDDDQGDGEEREGPGGVDVLEGDHYNCGLLGVGLGIWFSSRFWLSGKTDTQ